jgi:hypothetical protein
MSIKIPVYREGDHQEDIQTDEERIDEDYQVVKRQLADVKRKKD